MAEKKDIKTILRRNKIKPPKKEKVKISNPIDFRSFIPLLIFLLVVLIVGYKLFFSKNNVPSTDSIINSGVEEIQRGNLDEAGKKFEEILKKDSGNKEAVYNLALIKYIKKEYEEAISEFEKIAKRNPNDGNPYNILGNIFRDKKDYDQALLKYREAIKLDASLVQAYINMADVMNIMGNKKGAREIIDEGLLKNPENERLLSFKEIYAEKE